MTPEQAEIERSAKARYARMAMLRIAGMALVLLGVAIWRQGLFGFQDEIVGKLVAVVGVACMLLIPALLRRRYRTRG